MLFKIVSEESLRDKADLLIWDFHFDEAQNQLNVHIPVMDGFRRKKDLMHAEQFLKKQAIVFKQSHYLGLSKETLNYIVNKNQKNHSSISFDNFYSFTSIFDLMSGVEKGTIHYILRELLANALIGTIKILSPEFDIRKSSPDELYEQINKIDQSEDDSPVSVAIEVDADFITLKVSSPTMSSNDRNKLVSKISAFLEAERRMIQNKNESDIFFLELYNVQEEDTHGLGTVTLLRSIQNAWNGTASINYEFRPQTEITLKIPNQLSVWPQMHSYQALD